MRRLAAVAAVAALAAPVPAAPAPFPLALRDPRGSGTVEVLPGGRALHLVFLAAWCPPCVDELPRLQELHAAWARRGYRLVLVAVPARHTPERLVAFAREQATPGDLLWDQTGEVGRALSVDGLPTHLLFDARGDEVARAPALDDAFVREVERLAGALPRRRTR